MRVDEGNAKAKDSKYKTIKLYRGIASEVLNLHTRSFLYKQKAFLHGLLALRASGKREYPDLFDQQIQAFEKVLRTERQNFTDDREIALSYAKKNKGILIEVVVPIHEVVKHFRIEFQNYEKRKKKFELVYVVDGALLKKKSSFWKLKVRILN